LYIFDILPEHKFVQVFLSLEAPLQLWPPWEGAGWLHCLVLVLLPLQQLTEHAPYDVQVPHPPFSAEESYIL